MMTWETLLSAERKRRTHSNSESGKDPRTAFQKDYHRIIVSASFRRLQDKTQVFALDQSDFVRTRLTHSLEVSSFAKSLGQMIFLALMQKNKQPAVTDAIKEQACSVLECAGLIHDIGNPPFGHFGEEYIRDWFRRYLPVMVFQEKTLTEWLTTQMCRDFTHFDGNAQALRILTKLHFLVDEHGMNLSFALLNTIIKYPVSSIGIDRTSGDVRTQKMGYFYAERDIFADITNSTGAGSYRHPLVFILEAADDIAYKTADLEDAVKKSMLSYRELLSELQQRYQPQCAEAERKRYDVEVRKLQSYLAEAQEKGIADPEENAVQRWIISVQTMLLHCVSEAFVLHYEEIMAGTFPHALLEVSQGKTLAWALSDLADRYVFQTHRIYKSEIAAATIFDFLLERFVHALIVYDTDAPKDTLDTRMVEFVPDNYRKAYRVAAEGKDEPERLYLRLLLVTDLLCGMTDSYAKRLYQELSGIDNRRNL